MQKAKDHIRYLLLETARAAFFEKGFKGISMREISKRSGVGLSNIYNYFPNKDSLFYEVLRPLFESIDGLLRRHSVLEDVSIDSLTSEEEQRKWAEESMKIVSSYRKELKLLFFYSNGSVYENFTEEWIMKTTDVGVEYMRKLRKNNSQEFNYISPFFIHFASSWWISMIKEVVQHDELSKEETEQFVGEYIRFATGGWEKLIKGDECKRSVTPKKTQKQT